MPSDVSPRRDDVMHSVRQGQRKTNQKHHRRVRRSGAQFDRIRRSRRPALHHELKAERKRLDDIATDFAGCKALEIRVRAMSSQWRTVTQPTMTCIIVCSVWASTLQRPIRSGRSENSWREIGVGLHASDCPFARMLVRVCQKPCYSDVLLETTAAVMT